MKITKRRYLALRIDSDGMPTEREFMDAVWGTIVKLYGEYGASLTSLALIDFDMQKKTAVIRTSLSTLEMVRTSLASITRIVNREVAVHVVTVSGTIKALCAKL